MKCSLVIIKANIMSSIALLFSLMMAPAIAILTISLLVSAFEADSSVSRG